MRQVERLGNMLHHARNMVEGVGELCRIRPIAMAKPRIIRGDQVIAVGQALQQRLIHPRRGGQAVKQQQGRGVFRPGFPVENGQAVDLYGAIKRRVVHEDSPLDGLEPELSLEPAVREKALRRQEMVVVWLPCASILFRIFF